MGAEGYVSTSQADASAEHELLPGPAELAEEAILQATNAEAEGVARFKQNLLAYPNNDGFTRRFILHGTCSALDESMHYDLLEKIAAEFSVETAQDVFVVGSAKLGFSIAPHKRYRLFGDGSDIDVAIINHGLYEQVWHEVHQYKLSQPAWISAGFEKYSAWGWIRPDKLPRSPLFSFRDRWWDFFRSLQQQQVCGPYKVAGALYHDLEFLVRYQNNAVTLCRGSLEDRA